MATGTLSFSIFLYSRLMWTRAIFIITGFLLLGVLSAHGQGRGDIMIDQEGSGSRVNDSIANIRPEINYFKIDQLDKSYNYTDTLLDSKVHRYDPATRLDIDYLHLGNQGSAASPLKYGVDPVIGFREGHTQYDLYNFKLSDFKFFKSNVPFVNAAFSPMGAQSDFVIRTDFARSFDDGFSIAANYQRVNQEGDYRSQATLLTNFGAAIQYKSKNDRYTGFVSMISNVNQEANNGGHANTEDLDTYGRGNRNLVGVQLDDASTRYQQKLYQITNYYQLNTSEKTSLLLRYDLGYDTRYYKYADQTANKDSDLLFYKSYLTDTRGVRYLHSLNKWHNALYAYITNKSGLNIRTGIVYDRYAKIDQEAKSETADNIYLQLLGDVPLGRGFSIYTKAELGIGTGAGDFNLDGRMAIDIGKVGTLSGGMKLYRQSPSLLDRQFFITQQPTWEQDLVNPVGSVLYGKLTVPKVKFSASLEQHVVNNAIYYDTLAMPRQYEDIYTATILTLHQDLKVGIWNLENTALIQLMNENLYGLPRLWTRHNMYVSFPMFKRAIETRWGIETRLHTSYEGQAYNPAIGVFHQSGVKNDFFPATDVYFSGRVDRFRVFVKLQNVNFLIDNKNVFTPITNYAQQDWRVRFGVSWIFMG